MRVRAQKGTEAHDGPRPLPSAFSRMVGWRPKATPEKLILVPVAALILLSLMDFSLIVAARWEMEAAAREAARTIAREAATPAEAAAAARRRVQADGGDIAVTVIDGPVVVVEVSRPTQSVSVFGFWRLVAPNRLAMRGQARRITPASAADR